MQFDPTGPTGEGNIWDWKIETNCRELECRIPVVFISFGSLTEDHAGTTWIFLKNKDAR